MAMGILVTNTSGTVQIDELYKNLVVVDSGSVITSTTESQLWKATVAVVGNNPVIAIRSTGGYASVVGCVKSGSTYTYTVIGDTNATQVSYWIFDEPDESGVTMGVRVFDESSNVVFDSGLKYLRVEDLSQYGTGFGPYTTGRTYALIVVDPGFVSFDTEIDFGAGPVWTTFINLYLYKWTGVSCDLTALEIYSGTGQSDLNDSRSPTVLVVDVTDY